MDHVILVDEMDNEIGSEEKMTAHVHPAKLHRAFSIFILNDRKQLLLQKRVNHKKTWPGFWSNSCCSHPAPNVPMLLGAKRRLVEELGFICDLTPLFHFRYEAQYNDFWGEHELDHVFLGYYNGLVRPNPMEVEEFRFMDLEKLRIDMDENPDSYTPWLKICFGRFVESFEKIKPVST